MAFLVVGLCLVLVFVINMFFSARKKLITTTNKLSNMQSTIDELRSGNELNNKMMVQLSYTLGKSREAFDELESSASKTTQERNVLDELYRKERGRNKSIEVRTGQIMEKMVPLLDIFEEDHENAYFMGQPIDYIIYSEDKVVFLEVKTGGAQLTTKQRKIRDLINDKKVEFRVVRIKPEEEES